jgi:hypothetical protein
MGMVKQDLKGIATDWGAFPGENRVCCIVEGSPLDVVKMTQQHMPYVGLKVHPVAPVSDLHELLKHMDG